MLESVEAVLFDLDPLLLQTTGTISPSIGDAVRFLRGQNVPFGFLTNNSLHDESELVTHLGERQLELKEAEILLPATYLARWLSQKTPRATIFLLGSPVIRRELEKNGLRVIDEPVEIGHLCDYVVTGADPDFRYSSMVEALRCFEMGAGFVTVDEEPVYYGHANPVPGGGPVAAALRVIFGQEPIFTSSMPHAGRLEHAAHSIGTQPHNCLLVAHVRRSPHEAAREAKMPLILTDESLDKEHVPHKDTADAHTISLQDLLPLLTKRLRPGCDS